MINYNWLIFLFEMCVKEYGYGYLSTRRVQVRVQTLVPARVWVRVPGFFPIVDMGTSLL